MADAVNIPVTLEVTDISTGNVDMSEVQKSISVRLSGIKKSIEQTVGSVDTSALNKSLLSSFMSVERGVGSMERAQIRFNESMKTAGKSSEQYKAKLSEVKAELDAVKEAWNGYNSFMEKSYQTAKAKQSTGVQMPAEQQNIIRTYETMKAKYEADIARLSAKLPKPEDYIQSGSEASLSRMLNAYKALGPAVDDITRRQQNWNASVDKNKMTDEYQKAQTELDALSKKIGAVQEKSAKMQALGATESSWKSVEYDAEQLDKQLQALVARMQELITSGKAFRFDTSMAPEVIKLTEDYKKQEAELKSLEAEIEKYRASMQDTGSMEAEMATLTAATEQYRQEIARLTKERAQQKKVRDAARTTYRQQVTPEKKQTAKEDWDKQKQAVKDLDAQIVALNAKLADTAMKYQDLTARVQSVKESNRQAVEAMANLSEQSTEAASNMQSISQAQREMERSLGIQRNAEAMANLSQRASELEGSLSGVSGETQNVQNNSTAAWRAATRFINGFNSGLKKLGKGIGSLISKMSKLRKHTNSSTDSMGKGFKKLLRYTLQFGFGIRSTYFLIRRLRSTFVTGINTMATQFSSTNKELTALERSFRELKASLASAFEPIMSVAIPALIQLMSYLTAAMNTLAAFFAMLTGRGTFKKATAAAIDYADSISGTGSAADDAKNKLAEYDKLVVIDEDKQSGGGSNGNVFEGVTYEEVPVDEQIANFVARLKAAWENADFTEIGSILASKMATALDSLDSIIIDKAQALVTRVAKSIGTFINGVVSTDALSTSIGKIVGDTLNTAMIGLDTFLTTTKWLDVGKFIADTCANSINTFDWSLLGKTVADVISAGVSTWWSFTVNFDFSNLGTKISESINSFLQRMNMPDENGRTVWRKLGEALSNTVDGILTSINTAMDKVDWQEVGKKVGEMVSSIDWSKIVIDFLGLVKRFVTGLAEAFAGYAETAPLSASIATMLGVAILGLNIAGTIGSLIIKFKELTTFVEFCGTTFGAFMKIVGGVSLVITGIVTAIAGFFSAWTNGVDVVNAALATIGSLLVAFGVMVLTGVFSWPALIVAAVVAGVALLVAAIKNGQLADLWNWCVEGFKKAFEWFKKVGSWLKENVVDPIVNGFKKLFKIGSPSKVMEELAGYCVEGFTNKLSGMWDSCKQYFNNLKDKIVEKWTEIKNKTSESWTNIKDTVKTKASQIWDGVSTHFNTLKTKVSDTWNNIKTGATNGWSNVKSAVSNSASQLWSSMSGSFSSLKTNISNVWQNIHSSASSSWRTIISNAWTWGSDMVKGFSQGISSRMSSLLSTVSNLASRIKSYLHFSTPDEGPLADYETWMPDFMEGLAKGIDSNANKVENSVIKLVSKLQDAFTDGANDISSGFKGALSSNLGSFSLGIPRLTGLGNLKVPKLASGAVIPPNREFMAMLGDQRSGTNVEAPLETIKQALAEVFAEYGSNREPVVLQLNGKTVAQVVWDEEAKKYKQTGNK